MRGYDLVSFARPVRPRGGTLSIMDIYRRALFHVAQHDPKHPTGPTATASSGPPATRLRPSISIGLCGFCDIDDVVTLRKLHSRFQGHPHWSKLPGSRSLPVRSAKA